MLVACGGSNPPQKAGLYTQMIEAADSLMHEGLLAHDTVMLRKALAASESILRKDTLRMDRFRCYNNMSAIYLELGDTAMMLEWKEKAMALLPEDDLNRLVFYAMKYTVEGRKNYADSCLKKALRICNASLDRQYDVNVVLEKTEVLYCLRGEKTAREFLLEQYRLNPGDKLLKNLVEDWDTCVYNMKMVYRMLEKKHDTPL